jgi:iron complex transport system substrate-binding protein
MRVVSLLPAATEVVFALGAGDTLVGRSHECDFPAAARERTVCTSSKLDAAGTSYAIDARVRATLQEGLSIYRVDAATLDRLRPDVIVTQTQCDVCAASLRDVEAALATFVGSRPRLVALAPGSLAEVWGDVVRIAAALGLRERGEALAASLAARVDAIAARVPRSAAPPRVACVEWIEPLMAAGNWVPELVERAGGTNLFGAAGAHSPWLEYEALRAADPDTIVVMPCGWDVARARAELPALSTRPGWNQLAAVRAGRVFLVDGNQYFNRPGPRLVESIELLASLFHPGAFARFGSEGVDWARA